jgi:D-threo-aldose 1-dehydrogenase
MLCKLGTIDGFVDESEPPAMKRTAIGTTGLELPRIVFGTSCLGNQYEALADDKKLAISRGWFEHVDAPVFLDTAGKYGAGLSLEKIGENMRQLGVAPERVVISNKLGWKRTPLRTPEPTFEPGVWVGLTHDAQQCISAEGILDCWREGRDLLGSPYSTQMVSVHDPDEYLAAAESKEDHERRMSDILAAYRALSELKESGQVRAVGVGSKDWRVIREIAEVVPLDWAMFANSLTIYRHPRDLVEFVEQLARQNVAIINSAVFHAGFLTGGRFFNYRVVSPESDAALFAWREAFLSLCRRHAVSPMIACVQFALSPPGVAAVSLNTSRPERIAENVAAVEAEVPHAFWNEAKDANLIDVRYPYVG